MVNNIGDRCCPLRIGLFSFQMAFSQWLINGGDPITTYIQWDDPPSNKQMSFKGFSMRSLVGGFEIFIQAPMQKVWSWWQAEWGQAIFSMNG